MEKIIIFGTQSSAKAVIRKIIENDYVIGNGGGGIKC